MISPYYTSHRLSPSLTSSRRRSPPRSGVLRPGASYTFELRAINTAGRAHLAAAYAVTMNRPPLGGGLQLTYDAPAVALSTPITLEATGWADDIDDYPLTYAFSLRPVDGLYDPARERALSAPGMLSLIEDW